MVDRLRVLVVVAAVVVLAGCWTQSGQGPGRQGANVFETQITAATVAGLAPAWHATLPGRASEALADNGVAYLRADGAMVAVDLATGANRWSNTSLPGAGVPALAGGRLWSTTGGFECDLTVLDPATGGVSLQETFGVPPVPPASGGSSLCFTPDPLSTGPNLYLVWAGLATSPSRGCSPQQDDFVGVGIDATTLTGPAPVWSDDDTTVGCGPPLTLGDLPTPFGTATAVGSLVVAPRGSSLTALRASDCGKVAASCVPSWTADVGSTVNAPVVTTASGDVALTTADGRLLVLDGATGATKWSASVASSLTLPPATGDGEIFVAASDGTLAAYAADGCGHPTCSPSFTATSASPASVRPSIGADVAYVGSVDGTVTAFPATGCGTATCASLWSASTGSGITGAPVIASGRVVVGSEDGTVTAYGLPG